MNHGLHQEPSGLTSSSLAPSALQAAQAASHAYGDAIIKSYGAGIIGWLAYLGLRTDGMTYTEAAVWLGILVLMLLGASFCLRSLQATRRWTALASRPAPNLGGAGLTTAESAAQMRIAKLQRAADRRLTIAAVLLGMIAVLVVLSLAYVLFLSPAGDNDEEMHQKVEWHLAL